MSELSNPGDVIVDPFVGGGTVALEAAAAGRSVSVGDWNAYATLLTRAKLFPPASYDKAMQSLDSTWEIACRARQHIDLRAVPIWVRRFFHAETLRSALAFRDACVNRKQHFLLSCLLGILHHERPGFLSYPSSHLVPYLRDHKYPRDAFPRMYEEREVKSRMAAKVARTFKRMPQHRGGFRSVFTGDARRFPKSHDVQAVITSPPYMNELDYVRDNRLRLWFIDKRIPIRLECHIFKRQDAFAGLINSVFGRLSTMVRRRGYIALVLGDVTRGKRQLDSARIAQECFRQNEELRCFRLEHVAEDEIPDVRRSRRECRGTKVETVLIFRRRA